MNQYLTGNPKVTGFNVADLAMGGKTARAVIALRSALAQGTEPIALIGALALQMRNLAKAAAIRQGDISKTKAAVNEWALRTANGRLEGGHRRASAPACNDSPGRTNNARAAEATPYTHLRTP